MHFKSLPLHLFTFVCACTKLFICKIGFTIYLSVIIFSNKISWWPFCKISHFILKSAWCSRAIFNEFAESIYISDQIRSVAQSCPTLCDPMNRSTPGLPVPHQLPEFTQTHIHRVSDAIQPSHPMSPPSPPAPNPSQHQSLFQWVNSSHEVAKVLELQL